MFDYRSSLDKVKLTHYVRFRESPNDPRKKCSFEYIDAVMTHHFGLHADGWEIPPHMARQKYMMHRVYYAMNADGTYNKDCSLYVAYNFVTSSNRYKRNQVLMEFNPNKSLSLYGEFCAYFDIHDTEIHKFDVAFDLPNLSRHLVGVHTRCDVMTYGCQGNSTLYIAPKTKSSGRIKVYQKDVERGDNDKRLRVEITLRKDYDSKSMVERLSSLHYHHRTEHLVSNDAMLYLLAQSVPWERDIALNMMSPNTRKKYRALLDDMDTYPKLLDLSPEEFDTIVCDLVTPFNVVNLTAKPYRATI